MMEDGLSVCLPDDPNGNSKLMFSIIECLSDCQAVSLEDVLDNPVITLSSLQAVVSYIMDHLKTLMSHSEKNKMTSQSLSTIFGPLFTCHFDSDNIHKSIEVFRFLLDMWPSKNNVKNQPGELCSKVMNPFTDPFLKQDKRRNST